MKFIRSHVVISGDVKGMIFKYYTKQKAISLGLKGWVKNLPTGEIEAIFEGLEDKIKEMIEWCKKGPWLIKANKIKVKFSDYKGEFESFETR